MTKTELTVLDLRCPACAEHIAQDLADSDGVEHADCDYADDRARVTYDETRIDERRIRELIAERGYRCAAGAEATAARPRRSAAQLGHDAQLAPICCGTKCDRMQYELPHTSAQHEHDSVEPTDEHAGMDHDMSDPKVAVAMEHDMRRRFFLALILSIPVFLLSPVTANFFGLEIIGSEAARNWLMLVLSTPVVFYAGWIFNRPRTRTPMAAAPDHFVRTG